MAGDPILEFDAEHRKFCLQVELLWSLERDQQTIVSPIEFEMLDQWYEKGVPVKVIEKAMQGFMVRKRKLKKPRFYLLTHLEKDVEKAWQEYQQIHVGEAEVPSLARKKNNQWLLRLAELRQAWPVAAEVCLKIEAFLESDKLKDLTSFEALEEVLSSLEDELMQQFWQCVSEDQMAAFEEEVSTILSREDDPEFYQRLMDDMMRYHFKLPRLSILGG